MSKVAVIGGGPTGFAVARALQQEPAGFDIHIYEKQTQPGGVWVYTGEGPIYEDLTSNIHKLLMQYTGHEFGEDIPAFVDRRDIYTYIENYSKRIESESNVTVHWGTGVREVTQSGETADSKGEGSVANQKGGKWVLTTDGGKVANYDYIVVASGHYSTPYVPPIPGLQELWKAEPSAVSHTKTFVNAKPFKNQKVLLIGNNASGVDVAIRILGETKDLQISRREPIHTDVVFDEVAKTQDLWKPEAIKVDPKTKEVTFKDGSKGVYDKIVLATGYLYRLPFLEKYNEEVAVKKYELPLLDLPDEQRVRNLYKFIFYIADPTLAFAAFNKNVSPLPFAESQGAAIARVFSGRLVLPPKAEQLKEEEELVKRKPGADYFTMGYPVDAEYMAELGQWVDAAGPGGFFAQKWDDEYLKLREVTHLAKIPTFKDLLAAKLAARG